MAFDLGYSCVRIADTPPKGYLVVDYENISLAIIGSLSATDLDVWVFVGPQQRNLPTETVRSLLSSAARTQIVLITRQGKNSLDFHRNSPAGGRA